jgi:hypothetical protein
VNLLFKNIVFALLIPIVDPKCAEDPENHQNDLSKGISEVLLGFILRKETLPKDREIRPWCDN